MLVYNSCILENQLAMWIQKFAFNNVLLAGAGSTALHYAACGGNVQCCQVRILFCLTSTIPGFSLKYS